jgi:hypothetical protein
MTSPADIVKWIADLEKKAGRDAINTFGHELLHLLMRHGFKLDAPATDRTTAEPAAEKKATRSPPPAGTDAHRVLQTIRNNRGLTSAEVRRAADAAGKQPIKVKTFRTAMRRLRDRGFIRQGDDGRWHPIEMKVDSAA